MSESAVAHGAHGHHPKPSFISHYIFSLDHKMIGRQFLFVGLLMLMIGGILAMLVRWQLAWPETPVPGLRLHLRTLYLSRSQRRRHHSAADL